MVILNERICSLEGLCDPGWSLTEMLAGELRPVFASVAGEEPWQLCKHNGWPTTWGRVSEEGLESDIQRAARLNPALDPVTDMQRRRRERQVVGRNGQTGRDGRLAGIWQPTDLGSVQ